jgi:hypothetical protein
MKMFVRCITSFAVSSVLAVVLFGCGGGGGSSAVAPPTTSGARLSGTAATGSPIANGRVTLVDKNGNIASAVTGADGSFSLDATGLISPFMLQVVSDASGTYYSISADANPTTVNITPLTDMIIRAWYDVQGASVDTAFRNPAANPPPTPDEVKVIATMLLNTMQGWLQQAAVDTAVFNFINTPFNANGSGVDGVLDLTTVDPSTGSIVVSNGTITQNSTLATAAGSLNIQSTATTTFGGTSSPMSITTTVPTTTAEANALAGINATITAFAATVNQMGPSLSAGDIAPYVDPSFLDNGLNASKWESKAAQNFAGMTASFSGLQINTLDTTNNVADVSFMFSQTRNGVTESTKVEKLFRLISGSWLISGNNQIANVYASTWAWSNAYMAPKMLRFEVDDAASIVSGVTVSGPVLSSSPTTTDVPMVCDQGGMNGLPTCGTSYGSGAKRAFQLDISGHWPTLPATFTFTLTDNLSTAHTYTYVVTTGFGFDGSGTRVNADFPILTGTSPSTVTLSDILAGITVHGSVYVPLFVTEVESAPHFNYEGVSGSNNSVTNQLIYGTWDNTVAVPGQINNFTIVIPAVTSSSSCGAGCYTITFQGYTGDVQGGWFGEDACYSSSGNEPESCTNNGIEIH